MTLNNQFNGSNARLLSFDDIVFENRNKEYGSYDIRRRYMVSLLYASIFSISVITITVVCPMIYYKYFPDVQTVTISYDGQNIIDRIDTKIDPVIPPPEVKAPVAPQITFAPPVVVEKPDENALSMSTSSEVIDISTSATEPTSIVEPITTKKTDEIPQTVETIAGPEEPAMFKGGDLNTFHKWVQEQLVYPTEASEINIQGRVLVQFTVGPKGMIDDIKVVRSVDPLLDNEVVRVLKQSPLWSEPRQSGRAVKQQFFMPVFFQLR